VRRFFGVPVRYTRHAQRAFLLLSGFRNIHSPNIRRLISLTVYRLKHGLNPYLEALLRLRHALPIPDWRQVSPRSPAVALASVRRSNCSRFPAYSFHEDARERE
jgi:hypothetical protein